MDALCDLITSGGEFNLDEIDGKAALFHAAEYNYPRVIGKLSLRGLNLNLTDDQGKTAVFYANQNHSMDALCDLITSGAKFNLHEIDGKAVLFHAAKNDMKGVVKPLYDAGVDLSVTDNEGKTVVFYCNKDFLDALTAVDEVSINARDMYGRTPLFYAFRDNAIARVRYLIEEGGNLQVKDSCNLTIFSFFVENCISKNMQALQIFKNEIIHKEQQVRALTFAIFAIVYCQAPLLSVSGSPHLQKSYAIFNKENVLEALTFVRKQFALKDSDKTENLDKIADAIRDNEINVPHILSMLYELDANQNATDSDGNTAVHYATLLPVLGVTQKLVIEILEKLKRFGALFDLKNHQGQSPLLFCLSSITWSVTIQHNCWQSSIRGLVEVCRFLLKNGCTITNGSRGGKPVFHWIILLIKQGLELNEEAAREAVCLVMIDVLKLLSPEEQAVKNDVNSIDTLLNTPLHLWASIAFKPSQDCTSFVTGDHAFESILRITLDHLLERGAKLNPRNANEQTPLHMCRTWTALKLLLDAGANPNVMDSSGHSPLLVAAMEKSSIIETGSLYGDVTEEPEIFWESALDKGLDPWIADKQGESVLSVLIKSEAFVLARALVEISCKENYATNDLKLSLLNVISKDESEHTHWKTTLVEVILKSVRTGHLPLDSPLRFSCWNIVQFGMFDEKPVSTEQKANDEPSDDDGQPPAKKRREDESVKEQEEDEEPHEEHVSYDSVHCKIARQYLLYGADIHIRDASGISCLDIAQDCPSLQEILTRPIPTDDIPIRILSWSPVSDKHKGILAKVARQRKCENVDQIWYYEKQIGSGSFSLIFAGINVKDGREVAVKRIDKLRMEHEKDRQEIKSLINLADCGQVVRYISLFEDQHFSYVVLELMEGNLTEYLDGSKIDATEAASLCKDVIMGLEFLHGQKVLHRDLKPQNILYKVHPKTCLKIADFGLSRIIDSMTTTMYGTVSGTRCWVAPEVLKSKTDSVNKPQQSVYKCHFEPPSDMFSCGILLHYIFSGKKHPFEPTDYASKGDLEVRNETEGNIINGNMDGWDNSLSPEATHLIKKMLESNGCSRPSAKEALEHPIFWSKGKKVDFLEAVGNQKEFECPRSKRTLPLTQVETDLDENIGSILKHGSWSSPEYKNTSGIYMEMTKGKGRKNYATSSAVELVRFIRNTYEHYREKTFDIPGRIEQMLFNDFVFFDDFPDLVMEVYKAVKTDRWEETRDDIKFAMNKK